MTRMSKALRETALRASYRLVFVALALFLLVGCTPRPAQAQFIGYTSPQTDQEVLAPAGTACTGTLQIFNPKNLGQTQHYAYVTPSSSITSLKMYISGTDKAGNNYQISDTQMGGYSGIPVGLSVTGTGYYPKISIVVVCNPSSTGTFTLNYSGASSTFNQTSGGFLVSQIDKLLANAAPAAINLTWAQQVTPFGNLQGTLYFEYTGAGPAASTIDVQCVTQGVGGLYQTFALATTTAVVQQFPVAPGNCPLYTVDYVAGGGSASTYVWEYVFQQNIPTPPAGMHVTGTTATAIKNGYGTLDSIVVGTPAAGTISIFDLASASCTGTPSTNTKSVITGTSTAPVGSLSYSGTTFLNGICVKASNAMDFTVNFH